MKLDYADNTSDVSTLAPPLEEGRQNRASATNSHARQPYSLTTHQQAQKSSQEISVSIYCRKRISLVVSRNFFPSAELSGNPIKEDEGESMVMNTTRQLLYPQRSSC